VLLDHIEIHRYLMSRDQDREVADTEAVTAWYHAVYLPVVQVIREQGLLRDFPGRTETDLYLWISEHRAAVEQELGWQITPEAAAIDLAEQFSSRPRRVLARVSEKVLEVVRPEELEPGPQPGEWRKERLAVRRDDHLFADILVAVNGQEAGWHALDQAIEIARREKARLHGLHVLTSEEDEASAWIQARFDQRCKLAGVRGALAVEGGEVAHVVCKRSWWNDLVVLSLSYPPAPRLLSRLASGFRAILRRCPRPVLAVPPDAPFPERALLAYDGSRKADEALFVAAYLCRQWKMPLVVVTVIEGGRTSAETLASARSYLGLRGVRATLVRKGGPVAEAILSTADEHQCSLIVMGGYGFTPVLEVMLGSAVDRVLRESRRTMLICR
jgi:nucleotide-binding universal stress UspA family protein